MQSTIRGLVRKVLLTFAADKSLMARQRHPHKEIKAAVQVDQVWSSGITYVPLRHGWLYLVAVLDWYSRKVLAWQLSNTLDGRFCLQTLDEALSQGTPQVFNTDQGCQFTASAYTSRLELAGVAISMDGRGRALDNVFIERLWRSVKHEEVYRRDYANVAEAQDSLSAYFRFYNNRRRHQSLGYRTPAQVYSQAQAEATDGSKKIAMSVG